MINILTRLADWLITQEESGATDCAVPDEIIDDWLHTVESQRQALIDEGYSQSPRLMMLTTLVERIKKIKDIREKRCR